MTFMTQKGKILIGILVVGLVLIGGAWFLIQKNLSECLNGCEEIEVLSPKNQYWNLKNLSDEELLNYAMSPFDKEKMMGANFILGYHNGIPVRVSFPCSDVCPRNTIRIIRYDVSLGECESVGGEIKSIYVPFAEGSTTKAFCFPKVIVENNIYYFVPNVVIFTDKTEYEQGEEIKITVINNLDQSIWYEEQLGEVFDHCFLALSSKVQKLENRRWRDIELPHRCCGNIMCKISPPSKLKLEPNSKREIGLKIPFSGTYRLKFVYYLSNNAGKPSYAYSNEFRVI